MLSDLLESNPETGDVRFKFRDDGWFDHCKNPKASAARWNGRLARKPAFATVNSSGYLCGRVLHKTLMAHRVIWAIHNGYFPELEIDHINGEKKDNRLCNLRLATLTQNQHNTGLRVSNSTGYKGVSFRPDYGRFTSSISVNSKSIHLGSFDTAELASEAYNIAARHYHKEFYRG